jgi:probable F420-dependent oxidoreductase
MKVVYGFPLHSCPPWPDFTDGAVLLDLARRAERRGYAGVFFTEHPAPSQLWRESGGHDALDPFVALGAVAAVTERVRLFTYLTVVPYRNPFLLAKTVATLDRLSAGRVELGTGTGYQKGEFAALGVDFAERNELFDESLAVMKAAWTGEPVAFSGRHFSSRGNTLQPTPVQTPGPRLWFGGNSRLTLQRVVDHDGGWMPLPNSAQSTRALHSPKLEGLEDLAGYLEPPVLYCLPRLKDLGPGERVAHVRRVEELGIDWFSVNGEGTTAEEAAAFLDDVADELELGPAG